MLLFVSHQMQLISVSENNTLHLWSICDEENNASLVVLSQKELIQGRLVDLNSR